MELQDIRRIRLYRQHLTDPADVETVIKDLCGIQAQIPTNVPHALTIRTGAPVDPETYGENLLKSWTIRGTIHDFHRDDLPLFKADPKMYHAGDWFGWGGDALSDEGRTMWAQFILEKVKGGMSLREELKEACMEKGMTEAEAECMFESWGGGLREMCERSFLCYKANSRREFMLCPDYTPMGVEAAEKVLLERYLRHYAPATLRDMAYYFGWNQTKCKAVMKTLDCEIHSEKVDGKEYFRAGELPGDVPEIPDCIFLAGFDPLMMGYEKKDGFFVPAESLRGIFNLQGMVMAPVLLEGTAAARWKITGKKLTVTCFRELTEGEKRTVTDAAEPLFPKITKFEFV